MLCIVWREHSSNLSYMLAKAWEYAHNDNANMPILLKHDDRQDQWCVMITSLTIWARLFFLSLWNLSQKVLQGRSMAAQRIIRRHEPASGDQKISRKAALRERAEEASYQEGKTHLLLTKEYMSSLSSMKRFHFGFSAWRSRYMSLDTMMPSDS